MANSIEDALEEARDWIDIDGVQAVGQGKRDDRDVILVLASKSASELAPSIPQTLHGVAIVIVQHPEEFHAQ